MTAPTLARSPFPVPFGWFAIGYPEDFPTGEPKAIYYFDQHLVALIRDGVITLEAAMGASTNPHDLTVELRRLGLVA